MQSFNEVDMDPGRGAGSDSTGSRLLNSALSSVSANAKKHHRPSPYDRRAQDPKDRWQHDKFNEDGTGPGSNDRGLRPAGSSQRSSSYNAAHISQKLKIQDLHYEITETDLRELFEGVGDLLKAPEIVYDRSGRSTGVAYVVFQRAEDAAQAKREFHQQHAHGEPISISFEPYSGERRGAGGSSKRDGGTAADSAGGRRGERGDKSQSLLQRVEPLDLLSRMDAANSSKGAARRPNVPAGAPTGPAASRAVSSGRSAGSVRSARGPGGGGARTGSGKPGPKTATDLDAELDAFMKTPANASIAQSIHAPGPDGDVEMA
ncbi:hypothetical protein OC846_001150 [Tilletia horrida]|uniref:RRM domain-containing protein n=1 Tax=Tilletia horrida TaxID=155126 RepID=A0AAN6JU30_9BASI|nr:hypothetical protein OC845_003851 [Tilletia horrida]KAK0556453.1 hypothetical protein OC846_001150 [Tilletia horrida]KAK0569383.1 hypothetical protein OC861_000989 [Tilletia horrida]